MTDIQDAINAILETDFWPESIRPGNQGSRVADDNDGDPSQRLDIMIGDDGLDHGDVYLSMPGSTSSLRFRTQMGGGASPRVRSALLVLAEAVRRDNAALPQRQNHECAIRTETPDMETAVCLEVLKKLSSGDHLDPDVCDTTTPEQQSLIKRAIQSTVMDLYERERAEFLSR